MSRNLLIAMLLLFQSAATQVPALRGTVVDPTGALIPGAGVTVEDLAAGTVLTTVTDGRGDFVFSNVTLGKIRVTVTLAGFMKWTRELTATAQEIRLAVTLTPDVQNVNVSVRDLPMVGNNVISLSSASVSQRSRQGGRRRVVNDGSRRVNTESYDYIQENPFVRVSQQPRTTFAADVDTASYANLRRYLNEEKLPPKDAVRIEELVNYFKFDSEQPAGRHPVAIQTEVAIPFWASSHRLVRIGIRARDIDISSRKPANLVFLVDVSGSMEEDNKLPLVQRSLHLLVNQLRKDDIVTMVVYAGNSGLVLPPTRGDHKADIDSAIDNLHAGGSTNGGEGIQLAYQKAVENFVPDGTNRVILATDGDFNVGVTNEGDLVRLIEKQARSGVFLTVLGFGVGNYKDSTLEKLADKGHGNYAYIDTFNEAKRVLVEQMSGTLMTVAKDVKIQVEFNPDEVQAYRLIGYENRLLADEDFDNDSKQGGDMGAGHNVTAFFEVVPKGAPFDGPDARPLKYQKDRKIDGKHKGELLTVSLRYKLPHENGSVLLDKAASDTDVQFDRASPDFRFAAAVAAFGMLLRDSPNKGSAGFEEIVRIVEKSSMDDPTRMEFLELVRKASLIPAGLGGRVR